MKITCICREKKFSPLIFLRLLHQIKHTIIPLRFVTESYRYVTDKIPMAMFIKHIRKDCKFVNIDDFLTFQTCRLATTCWESNVASLDHSKNNNGYPVLYCLGKVCLIPKTKVRGINRGTETHLTRPSMAMGP